MNKSRLGSIFGNAGLIGMASAALLLSACASNSGGTIGSLQKVDIEIQETRIEGSLEKALASYQKYLQETPETALTPEAIRRIADLKIKQAHRAEEGAYAANTQARTLSAEEVSAAVDAAAAKRAATGTRDLDAPQSAAIAASAAAPAALDSVASAGGESQSEFEARASAAVDIAASSNAGDLSGSLPGDNPDALLAANAREAIALYKKLLTQYPQYERNDQVMYQLSRAYEETGEIDEAVTVLRQLVAKYPASRHLDEAHFRLGEYYFTRKKYLDAEESYGRVVAMGETSSFYEISLYKRGWALFKQDMYEMALDDFVHMLDYKVAQGYDFEQKTNETERKHIEDTFRVVSLSFSYLGGADSIVDYFNRKGARDYESYVYSHLGEYYLEKRRYQDAAKAYDVFVERNPLHKVAPDFSIRVIEIYQKGGFPRLVLEAKKAFANTYALDAEYWTVFDIQEYASTVEFLQTNLIDLASHYHAAYQNVKPKDEQFQKKRSENYAEAIHWYRRYLKSFADQPKAPGINYQLAGLMLENRDFMNAAQEYERTAYQYPAHEEASEAGYAAVFSYREHLKNNMGESAAAEKVAVKKEIIRSSLTFAETFPEHGKAPQILLGAVDDLYKLKSFPETIQNGRLLLEKFPAADQEIRRTAWILVAHASFDTEAYVDAEAGYQQALALTASDAKDRADLVDNLAGSIYQQGDVERKAENHLAAAEHFLRIRAAAPGASILATAEYDAAASLIQLENWGRAASVLKAFRVNHPQHELQKEVTKKLAVVYQESGELLLAGAEFERIERESEDEDVRREALTQAADLYAAAKNPDKALTVLNRYVKLFPRPVEPALETRQKIADIHNDRGDRRAYFATLEEMVRVELGAGNERNDRTRYLAGNAALVLAEPRYDAFREIQLVAPLERNLNNKRTRMKAAITAYSDLIDYKVADVTAAATYYLGEIYLHFSRALKDSERPTNLSPMELEEYELALEEQIYPFEEKSISVHEKNIDLMAAGIYNQWVAKTIDQLAGLVPARYDRKEDAGHIVATIVPVPEQPEEVPAEELAEVPKEVPKEELATEAQTAEVEEAPEVTELPVDAPEDAPADQSEEPSGESPTVIAEKETEEGQG